MPLPSRMTAIAIREAGAPDVLVPQERDMPVPKTGEVLVKAAAAGINRPDVMQRQGKYPPPPGAPDIPVNANSTESTVPGVTGTYTHPSITIPPHTISAGKTFWRDRFDTLGGQHKKLRRLTDETGAARRTSRDARGA